MGENPLLFEIAFWEAVKHKKPYVAIELFAPDTIDQVLVNHKKSIQYLMQNF